MMTLPSPRIVLPENIDRCLSSVDMGFTTISSVWKTASTTMPKVWLPTCMTTMKPCSPCSTPGAPPSGSAVPSSSASGTTGSSLLRSRSTGVFLMRSMRWPDLWCTRTSSITANCGMAKRSPAASTMSAETMARVSGILITKVVPRPSTERTSMVPPMISMLLRTTSMPTPRPDTLVILAAVEKPAWKMNLWIWASFIFSSSASVARPFSSALARMRATSSPRPSSAISMMMCPPS